MLFGVPRLAVVCTCVMLRCWRCQSRAHCTLQVCSVCTVSACGCLLPVSHISSVWLQLLENQLCCGWLQNIQGRERSNLSSSTNASAKNLIVSTEWKIPSPAERARSSPDTDFYECFCWPSFLDGTLCSTKFNPSLFFCQLFDIVSYMVFLPHFLKHVMVW